MSTQASHHYKEKEVSRVKAKVKVALEEVLKAFKAQQQRLMEELETVEHDIEVVERRLMED